MTKQSQEGLLYGHERRTAENQEKRKKSLQQTKELCQEHWTAFINEIPKSQLDVIADEQIYNLYEAIYKEIETTVPAKLIPSILFERLRFFDKVNHSRKNDGLPPLPKPVIASRAQRPKNINEFNNFSYLPTAQNIVSQAFDNWQQKNIFSLLDCVTWFLFSLVSFAGYNDEKVIKAIYEYLDKNRSIYQVFNDLLIIPIKVLSPHYGNRVILINADMEEVYQTRLIFVDDISRLWLLKIQTQRQQEKGFPKYHQVIKRLGEFTKENFTVKSTYKSKYLKGVPIYWQTLPEVRLDMQLVEVLVGQQNQTSVSEEHLLRYFRTIKTPKVIITDEHIGRLVIEASNETSLEPFKAMRFKSDAVKEIRAILNGDKKKVKEQLETLLNQGLYPNQERLVKWMIDLFVSGNKISTLKRYLSDVGNDFIASTRDTEFLGWAKYDYHYIYNDIVANKNQNRVGFTTTIICSLHSSLKKHYQAPDIDLKGGGDPQIVSSYLIPSHVYQVIQSCVSAQEELSDYNQQVLSIVITLLYRTGMRIGEILGLQVKDIEYDNQGFNEYNIIVRSNAHRDLKSDDGTRRIHLSVLLLIDELEVFKRFFKLKKEQSSRYLFTLEYQSAALSRHSIEQPVSKILASTSYSDMTLHSFRHNAISNMAIIIRCKPELAVHFTDYSEAQIEAIKHQFLGKVRKISTNYWDALMEFAGHADLNTTFSSYIHTADIIANHQLQEAKLTLPLSVVNKLIGASRMNLKQHNKKALDTRANTVNLNQIRKYINNKVEHEKLLTTRNVNKAPLTQDNNELVVNHHSAVFGHYSREVVEKLLYDIEDGQLLGEASGLNFRYDDALMVYERAVSLVQNIDGSLSNKLIPKTRKQRSEHILIAPTPLHYHQEKALVNLCFDNLEELYKTKESRRKVKEILNVFYDKVNTSKSEIRFTFQQQKLFYKYLNVMCLILPSKHWRVNISCIKSESYVDDKKKRIVKSFVDEKAKTKEIEGFKKDKPNFYGELKDIDTYNGYSLSIISPIKQQNNKGGDYSSALMRYVLHLMLIVEGLSH